MKFTFIGSLGVLVLLPIICVLFATNIANAKLYDLNILNIDFQEAPKYKKLSYKKTNYNGFTVNHYSTSSINIRQNPYEIFSVSITTYKSLPSNYAIKDALSQSAYGYLQSQGCTTDKSKFLKLHGKDALEIEYSESTLGMRNIATFLLHGKSVITIEYRCSGQQIKDYSPYRNFLKTLVLK